MLGLAKNPALQRTAADEIDRADVYCQRGEMENRIKERRLDLFADRTSCLRFLANPFQLLLSSAAYVRAEALGRRAL